ncbi:hypothetical protein BKA57DRAFT_447665 [Linnemannia elongata]|nr:hypothetical protein BKA57DRAFT_447665 [Linnemannia elongata]
MIWCPIILPALFSRHVVSTKFFDPSSTHFLLNQRIVIWDAHHAPSGTLLIGVSCLFEGVAWTSLLSASQPETTTSKLTPNECSYQTRPSPPYGTITHYDWLDVHSHRVR